jgi:hypothetical protein
LRAEFQEITTHFKKHADIFKEKTQFKSGDIIRLKDNFGSPLELRTAEALVVLDVINPPIDGQANFAPEQGAKLDLRVLKKHNGKFMPFCVESALFQIFDIEAIIAETAKEKKTAADAPAAEQPVS